MNSEEMMIALCSYVGEEAEALRKAIQECAERVKCTVEEMIGAVFRIVSAAGTADIETLEGVCKELEEIGKEPRARRRKMERSRARTIEQRYRAEIHRFERERFYRRIFKPP